MSITTSAKRLFETNATQVCEVRLKRNGGLQFWAQIVSTVAQDADGAPLCRAVLSDITERKKSQAIVAEEELRALSRKMVLSQEEELRCLCREMILFLEGERKKAVPRASRFTRPENYFHST